MIRSVNRKMTVSKTIQTEESIILEKITTVLARPEEERIDISVDFISEKDEVLDEKRIVLYGDNYRLLYSDADFFEEGKQPGSYREKDLWKVMDKVMEES